jgi:benzoyl-CoA reductase/2-hydroxyglutaryl-CoA dehydratase subunit BcrC/BadD/HgdB
MIAKLKFTKKEKGITMIAEPLFNDEYVGAPAKRILSRLLEHKERGSAIVGTYCGYAPLELVRAMGIVPAVLCAFANSTISTAESVLPSNLCPLVKSSFGFIQADTCPFFSLSQAVIAETTCDGKKKMFELIADKRPMFVMDLPHVSQSDEALTHWTTVVHKLKTFLETTFDRKITETGLEEAIRDSNRKNDLVMKIFDYAYLDPPVLSWSEILDIVFLATPLSGKELNPVLMEKLEILESRKKKGLHLGKKGSPRILITGCPIAGDSTKVFKAIEEEGGVIVGIDSCTGTKPFINPIPENSGDPIAAIAGRYLNVPCSCMTPNNRRLNELSRMIKLYRPDAVIDVVLHACHSYNIESSKIEAHVSKAHALPFLKIVTDYSAEDIGQIKTRIGALLEMVK